MTNFILSAESPAAHSSPLTPNAAGFFAYGGNEGGHNARLPYHEMIT